MNVTLQYFDSCPNWKVTDRRIRQVAADNSLDISLNHQFIGSPEDADKYGFHGSPSILVNGVDPFATDETPIAYACRLYESDEGIAEAPTIEQIARALGV